MLPLIFKNTLLIGMLSFVLQGLAHAASPEKSSWDLTSGLNLRYEDNVFALSDANQESYKANPQNFPGIESPDDMVWSPFVGITYRTVTRNYPSALSLGISGDFYRDNSRKSFETFKGGLRQNFAAQTHAAIGYTFIPQYFLGEQIISSTTTEEQTLQLHQVVLVFDKDFSSSFNSWIEGRYTVWNFNHTFNALDTAIIKSGLGATYKFNRYIMVGAGYFFDTASAQGGDVTGDPKDISYISHSVFISPTVKLSRPAILKLNYRFQYTRYTTDLSQDLDDFGRKTRSHSVSLGLNYKFTPSISANLSYDRVMKDSNREFSTYTQNRYLIGITYSLK